jgi:hypothetical protein
MTRAEFEARSRELRAKVVPGRTGFLYFLTNPKDTSLTITAIGTKKENRVEPGTLVEVASGCFFVEATCRRFLPTEGVVCVGPDEAARPQIDLLSVPMKPGSATFISDPLDAVVWLDGRRVGVAPMTLKDIPEGDHQVSMALGDLIWSGTVTVPSDAVALVKARLSPRAQAAAPAAPVVRQPVPAPAPSAPPGPRCRNLCYIYAVTSPMARGEGQLDVVLSRCLVRCESENQSPNHPLTDCLRQTMDATTAAACDAIL